MFKQQIEERGPENEDKGFEPIAWWVYLVWAGASVTIPLAVGLPLYFTNGDLIYLETLFAVVGLFGLVIVMTRIHFRDGRNFKKNKSVLEDKTTPEYRDFVKSQFLFGGISIATALLSLIVFWISQVLY